MLLPNRCMGYNPYICHSGPFWSSNEFPCEKALISGDENTQNHCTLTLQNQTSPILHEPVPNIYVLSTHGSKIYQNCKGRSEVILQLPRGVYYIKINHTCALKTASWTLRGVQHITQNSTISVSPIVVDLASPLEKALHQTSDIASFHLPHWNSIQEIITTNFSTIPPLPVFTYVTPDSLFATTAVHPWINSSTFVILLAVIIIVLTCGYTMYKKKTGSPTVVTAPTASSNLGIVQKV